MARDLDFGPRQRPAAPPTLTQPVQATKRPASGRSRSGIFWTLVILIFVAAGVLLWQLMKPAPVVQDQTSGKTSAQTLDTGTELGSSNVFASDQSGPVIQIYDSGAGADKVKDVIGKLKALGYRAEDLETSQFNYDKTYIWYRQGLESEAEKLKGILNDRVISLKETKIAGSFDILILLGKQ